MKVGAIKKQHAVVIACVVLIIIAAWVILAYQSAVSQADYNKGYEIGLEAYTYGLPLLETNTTFETMTSIDVSNGAFGPVNQFNNVRSLNNPNSTAVVAPGSTGLSSIAWLESEQRATSPPCTGGKRPLLRPSTLSTPTPTIS